MTKQVYFDSGECGLVPCTPPRPITEADLEGKHWSFREDAPNCAIAIVTKTRGAWGEGHVLWFPRRAFVTISRRTRYSTYVQTAPVKED